ncbi:MAG: hypothetical protein WAV05_16945 [Anaerolineales bacterium]
MKDKQSSITTSGIAAARAVEAERPEGIRIYYDPHAARFLNLLFLRFKRILISTCYSERLGLGVGSFWVAQCRTGDEIL